MAGLVGDDEPNTATAPRVASTNERRTSRIKRWKDTLLKANSIDSALKPVMLLGQLLGFPVKYFRENGAWKTKIVTFLMLASLIKFVYCCYIVLFEEVQGADETLADTFSLVKYTLMIKVSIGLASVTCLYFATFSDAASHGKNMEYLDTIVETLNTSGVDLHYSKIKSRVICALVTKSLFYLCIYVLDSVAWNRKPEMFNIIMMHVLYFPGVLSTVISLKFSSLVMVANISLQIINAELELIFMKKLTSERKAKNCNIQVKKTRTRQTETLMRMETRERDSTVLQRLTVFWKAYDKTCDYVGSVNDAYSMKLLIIFTSSFMIIVYNLFLFLATTGWALRDTSEQTIYPLLVTSILLTIMHTVLCYTAIKNCSQCKDLAEKTAAVVNKMMITEPNQHIVDELHLFSTYMLQRQPEFVALGLFPIDNTLLFTMAGSATTYLVILAQFYVSD